MSKLAIQLSITVFLTLAVVPATRADLINLVDLEKVNSRLAGHVVDYTNNHGTDRRVFSPILGMPRDMYVYLPPGYNPTCAYPLVFFFHMASVDECYFVKSNLLKELDDLIVGGKFPPAVVACPDGTYNGWHHLSKKHSFYVNGIAGRFEDHILQEVVPFLIANYSTRPERQARALVGFSAGAYGAMGMAIEHRELFGSVVSLAGPINMRYSNCDDAYLADFDPMTYREKARYNPKQVIGVYYGGLWKIRAQKFIEPVFGQGDAVAGMITASNPADLIWSTNLQPGDLSIYINYPGRDNFNFDAHAESFQWLAAQKGIDVTLVRDPGATHRLSYFRDNLRPALCWLGQRLLPPVPSVAATRP